MSDPTKPFILTTDVSDFAIGAVLTQDQGKGEQSVAYDSRKLSKAEQNYPVHKKELLAVVHAIKLWRPYIEGQKFTVITDHAALEYINKQPKLSRRQARWLDLLQSSNYTIKYRPGKTNVVADALSRKVQLKNISTINVELINKQQMFEGYEKDKHFAPILEILQNPTPKPKQLAQVKNYELKDKQIYLKKGQRLVIPRIKEIITKVLEENHDNEIAGHVGTEKTYEIISRSYFWPGMNKDIKKYIQTCESCQRNKSRNQQPTGLLQPLQIPTKKWEHVTMDFIVQLPTTKQGFDSIVVFVDKLSKRAHFCPTYTTATAPEIAKIFFIIIFRYHGLPKAIISDRDAKFTSNFWQTLFKQVETKLSMSTAFHPQTNS